MLTGRPAQRLVDHNLLASTSVVLVPPLAVPDSLVAVPDSLVAVPASLLPVPASPVPVPPSPVALPLSPMVPSRVRPAAIDTRRRVVGSQRRCCRSAPVDGSICDGKRFHDAWGRGREKGPRFRWRA